MIIKVGDVVEVQRGLNSILRDGKIDNIQIKCTDDYEASVVSRLNKYCKAATTFGVEGLLRMTNCDLLQDTFDSCLTATSPSPSCGDCQVWQGITFPPSPCKFEYCVCVRLLIIPMAIS